MAKQVHPNPESAEITAKAKALVDNYLATGNKKQSAIDAGYSENSAHVTAHEVLNNPKVYDYLKRRQAELCKLAQIHTDTVIGLLVEIASGSADDLLEEDGTFDYAKAKARGATRLIKDITIVETFDKKGNVTNRRHVLKVYDRMNALNQLRDVWGIKMEARKNIHDELERMIQLYLAECHAQGVETTREEAERYLKLDSEPVN